MPKKVKCTEMPDLTKKITSKLLGAAIRARRTQNKLKLENAAALCGVAKQTLANIEKGEANSQINTILQVCSGLGIKLYIQPWHISEEANDERH